MESGETAVVETRWSVRCLAAWVRGSGGPGLRGIAPEPSESPPVALAPLNLTAVPISKAARATTTGALRSSEQKAPRSSHFDHPCAARGGLRGPRWPGEKKRLVSCSSLRSASATAARCRRTLRAWRAAVLRRVLADGTLVRGAQLETSKLERRQLGIGKDAEGVQDELTGQGVR